MTGPMEIPVIDLSGLNGSDEERSRTLAELHDACKDWGFFWVENHGVDAALMEEVKRFVYGHYEEHLEAKFYASELAKNLLELDTDVAPEQVDWESTYFIQHRPKTNVADFPEITPATRSALEAYIAQMVSLAERLGECMSLNLGLPARHVADAFAPAFVGTKFAMYPPCPPRPGRRLWGLRAHTDAGGIILLLQDDAVGGLEFLRRGQYWVPVGPTKGSRLFVNIGDQVEVLSAGAYRSVVHRVAAAAAGDDKGRPRLSVATFYNPGPDAVVAPATVAGAGGDAAAAYPGPYRFGDYLEYYQGTKFGDKDARFQALKKLLA